MFQFLQSVLKISVTVSKPVSSHLNKAPRFLFFFGEFHMFLGHIE